MDALQSLAADRVLFEGHVQGLVATTYQNERPLCGLAGMMDWRFHGSISQCIIRGAITGEEGECVYFPVGRNGSTYHLLLVGAGRSVNPGHRQGISVSTMQVLQKNLSRLGLTSVVISRADFGSTSVEIFSKPIPGISLWIAP